ncbi:hypothetical protein AWJ20_86 [Sugiyamaella lignohabitans]|uniref:tRNA-guanine(15) transglycosylase-like domain-containing protein n=1 Tax=Sugiyamaella lignohabitans TaxID=796027 RepID=A0A167CLP1_9ASCO|nr:uncharacterized protein AWJ20_86 [Sugiyamaella lignohabitans]ANB11862.1 hypothetical protein AWJ20_86 [Sugiyamaella lignohabitans]
MTSDSMASSSFQTIKAASSSTSLARIGALKVRSNSSPVRTPTFLCPTSRGVIPHLSPDNVVKCETTASVGALISVEDFMEKAPQQNSALLKYPGPTRDLFSFPSKFGLALSHRRPVPVPSPQANFDDKVSVMTPEGFKYMTVDMYSEFITKFEPDMVFSIPDIPNLSPGGKPGNNRAQKMLKRTEKWLDELLEQRSKHTTGFEIFAPILPGLAAEFQSNYLQKIKSDARITGISLWNAQAARLSERQAELAKKRDVAKHSGASLDGEAAISTVTSYVKALHEDVSRLAVAYNSGLETPHEVLDLVNSGVDLFVATGINDFTDAGVALDFTFPASEEHPDFGFNLWDPKYATDMTNFGRANRDTVPNTYYRAYVHHLLNAREMTSWVLLQMHNIAVFNRFFEGIQKSIENGTFEQEREKFVKVYGTSEEVQVFRDLYKKKDSVPTVRGYHISYESEVIRRGEGSTQRLNDPPFKKYKEDASQN